MKGYLADTNIVVRFANKASAQHKLVYHTVGALWRKQLPIHITPQVCAEFWSVATRPADVNGLGWTVEETREVLNSLLELFPLLPDTPDIFGHWLTLVTKHKVQGKQVHDAHLVAAMQTHSIEHLLTLNAEDFKRYAEITPVHPGEVSTVSE
jgi:predicted nucleic acid-binding protein